MGLAPAVLELLSRSTLSLCLNRLGGCYIIELIEAAGCQLKYLPSYSPDFNLH